MKKAILFYNIYKVAPVDAEKRVAALREQVEKQWPDVKLVVFMVSDIPTSLEIVEEAK